MSDNASIPSDTRVNTNNLAPSVVRDPVLLRRIGDADLVGIDRTAPPQQPSTSSSKDDILARFRERERDPNQRLRDLVPCNNDIDHKIRPIARPDVEILPTSVDK